LITTALILAIPAGRSAVALLPMSLGEWCHRQARDACAELAWTGAAALVPSDPSPPLALGVLFLESGDLVKAEGAFRRALNLVPNSAEAANNLGVVHFQRGDYDRAADYFGNALLGDPGSVVSQLNLADSLLARHLYEEALAHYRSALGLEDATAGTLVNMAVACWETGGLLEAEEIARKAVRLQPDLAAAHAVLGSIAILGQQPEQALQSLSRARELGDDSVQVNYFLGRTYAALGEGDEAAIFLRRALAVAGSESARDEVEAFLATIE
jgi:tetratricopeptide (TPR) repeat protein